MRERLRIVVIGAVSPQWGLTLFRNLTEIPN